jgi:hypothetical protein
VRCSVSRGVLASEPEQCRCKGTETGIGQEAYDAGSSAVRKLFGKSRKIAALDYDLAVDSLTADGDRVAKAATVAHIRCPRQRWLGRPNSRSVPTSKSQAD